jgi:hypothetical protein
VGGLLQQARHSALSEPQPSPRGCKEENIDAWLVVFGSTGISAASQLCFPPSRIQACAKHCTVCARRMHLSLNENEHFTMGVRTPSDYRLRSHKACSRPVPIVLLREFLEKLQATTCTGKAPICTTICPVIYIEYCRASRGSNTGPVHNMTTLKPWL